MKNTFIQHVSKKEIKSDHPAYKEILSDLDELFDKTEDQKKYLRKVVRNLQQLEEEC